MSYLNELLRSCYPHSERMQRAVLRRAEDVAAEIGGWPNGDVRGHANRAARFAWHPMAQSSDAAADEFSSAVYLAALEVLRRGY